MIQMGKTETDVCVALTEAEPGIIKKTLTSGLQRAAAKGMTPTIKADCVAEKPKDLKYSGKNGSKHPVAEKFF